MNRVLLGYTVPPGECAAMEDGKTLSLGTGEEVTTGDWKAAAPTPRNGSFDKSVCWRVSLLALTVLSSLLLAGNLIALSRLETPPLQHYECLYAVGGGPQSNTGGLPQYRSHNVQCTDAIMDYTEADGQYWKDLEDAGLQAKQYYSEWPSPSSEHMLVFDIDETSLSNIRELAERPANNMDGSYAFNETAWDNHLLRGMAPAIEPILDVYKLAYNRGMSVAFITGRAEPSRKATEKNLERIGYGVQCKKDANGVVERTEEPCYVELHLRGEGDMTKLASVYKPERRKQLQDAGYSIIGAFGDQISDLNGLYPAHASWKLPNPMYYIL